MTARIACVIIATEARRDQAERVVARNVWMQDFDEVVLVGDWAPPKRGSIAYRYLCVAPLTRTTTDALVKRDVGTLATTADIIVYLCDDHILHTGFAKALREVADERWDVIVPNRFTRLRDGAPLIPLPNGEREAYCGGHAGVFRRDVVTRKPWSAHAHHRNWDALISYEQRDRGAHFLLSPRDALSIIDLNPDDPRHELDRPVR